SRRLRPRAARDDLGVDAPLALRLQPVRGHGGRRRARARAAARLRPRRGRRARRRPRHRTVRASGAVRRAARDRRGSPLVAGLLLLRTNKAALASCESWGPSSEHVADAWGCWQVWSWRSPRSFLRAPPRPPQPHARRASTSRTGTARSTGRRSLLPATGSRSARPRRARATPTRRIRRTGTAARPPVP